jgi:type II secretory ATPase GspE/PulE/Tfp pilus assembly ATPase PilB-like protein
VESRENRAFLERIRKSEGTFAAEDIEPILQRSGGVTLSFLEEIIEKEYMSKDRACRMWADTLGYAYVNPLIAVVTADAIQRIPFEIATKAKAIGLYVINNVLTIAMARPEDKRLLKQIEAIANVEVSPVFAPSREIEHAIQIYYETQNNIEDIENFEKEQEELLKSLTDDDLKDLASSNSLSRLLDGMIFFAVRERASDIHMEESEDGAIVRFRIDGKLIPYYSYGKAIHRAFASRVKVLCRLNVAESRFPQDGRFSMPFGMGKADFRASLIPTVNGTKVVLRILPGVNRRAIISLDQMMMSSTILEPFRRVIKSPNGIIFVTGPTGSGKTTTLYAALEELNTPDKNISTIEDPVEIKIDGITQSQVNSHIDLNFGLLLRSILRQDPDIILVGEIRDLETAKIATEAALTGHLVMSTLHTNNAIQAILRMMEIGIEPYMVAPSIMGVLGQRLAARICEGCKRAYFPGPEVLERYFYDIPEDEKIAFSQGIGCANCRETGFSGRIAFHELLLVDDQLRSLISTGAGQHRLLQYANKLGYRSLRHDGLKKVLLGLTTVEEIEKHTVLEWDPSMVQDDED